MNLAAAPARNRCRALTGLLMSLSLATTAWAAQPATTKKPLPPELPSETLQSGGSIAAGSTERVYVADVMISNIVDGRLRVFDARDGKLLGMVNTGFAGSFALSAKADEVYVATTYLSRGGRGERVDVLEVWDSSNLKFKHEVLLPPKRAQVLNYRGMLTASADGRFLLSQNATPATSLAVIDLQERKAVGEISTPGCWGSMAAAAHPARFSMLCGDGKVATVTLDDKGQVADRQLSDKVFDPDKDAWFHTAERIGDRFFFLSFLGNLTELDLAGPVARVVGARSLVTTAQAKQGWRPGGYQAFAVHPDGQLAVVSMHDKGREGTHKVPAKALWVVNVASGKRVAVVPKEAQGAGVVSITFSKSGKRLQALDGITGAMRVWDWQDNGRMKLVSTVKPAGQAALQLESHD